MEGGSTNRDFQHRIRLLLKWPDVFLPEKWWMIDWSFSYTLAVLPFDQIISKFAQLYKIVTCPVRSTSLPHTSSTFPHTILFDETWHLAIPIHIEGYLEGWRFQKVTPPTRYNTEVTGNCTNSDSLLSCFFFFYRNWRISHLRSIDPPTKKLKYSPK